MADTFVHVQRFASLHFATSSRRRWFCQTIRIKLSNPITVPASFRLYLWKLEHVKFELAFRSEVQTGEDLSLTCVWSRPTHCAKVKGERKTKGPFLFWAKLNNHGPVLLLMTITATGQDLKPLAGSSLGSWSNMQQTML